MKKAVHVIGGADGPTSIFLAGKTGKKSFKQKIDNCMYRQKRKRIARRILPGTHSIKQVVSYMTKKYNAKEISEQSILYQEQRKCLRENLILIKKAELVGDVAVIAKPDAYNEETIQSFSSCYNETRKRGKKRSEREKYEVSIRFTEKESDNSRIAGVFRNRGLSGILQLCEAIGEERNACASKKFQV